MDFLSEYLTFDHCLDALGFVTGILYLYWEYFADPKMWIAEIIIPIIMCWLFLDKGLYADFGMNVYYFLIAIYGYIAWTRGAKNKEKKSNKKNELPISHIGIRHLLGCIGAFAAIYILIAYWLLYFTDSNVPYIDAFTTALSIIAMWMLARKFIEQWLAWILVDAVSVGLYIYKDIPLSALRYAIYTIIAFFGYAKWHRMMISEKS